MRLLYVHDDLANELLGDPGREVVEFRLLEAATDLADHLTDAANPVDEPELMEQVRRNVVARNEFLARFDVVDAEGLARFAGSMSANLRATATRWLKDGTCFAIDSGGRRVFPVFQFDAERRRPHRAVAAVLRRLHEARLDEWALALWWTTPHEVLAWRMPADVLVSEPDAVVAAAELDRDSFG
jgi:hypothetical protein